MFKEWLELYKQAWESRDANVIPKIFAENAVYWETPFLKHEGLSAIVNYWKSAPCRQKDILFEYSLISVEKNIAHWKANFIGEDNQLHKLDGIFILDFDSDGKCLILREWWHSINHTCSS